VTELFRISDLHARPVTDDTDPTDEILRGVTLSIAAGEVHAIMGPNGCGKSTLASTLLASPEYEVTGGDIFFKGDNITEWTTDVRAKAGIFLAFQYPQEIAGVSVIQFLRQSLSARKGIDLSVLELRLSAMDWMKRLGMDSSFVDRYLNEGFSGGEKKRNEIMQMALLEPDFAVLDETDSGLDIDALRIVAKGIREVRVDRPNMGILLITHYQRLLDELQPDHVHIMIDGRIVKSGGIVAKGIREVRVDRPNMGILLITHYQRLLDELQPDHVHIMIDGRIVKSGGMEVAAELEKNGYEAYKATVS